MNKPASRREIFQTAATLTAASYSRVLRANDRINAGVIGTGNLGMRHLRIYMKPLLAEGIVTVAGVSDIYTGAKRRAQEQTKLESRHVHHDYRDLLARKDIDAVYIVTPEHWHHRMALDALDAGKDVYLEKPMTYTIPQAKEVAQAVRRTGRVLQVGSQWGSDPLYHHARSVIERGWLGKVLWAQSTYSMNSVHGVWQYTIEPEASPQTVDWNAFLGSAPKRPFSGERFFRWRKYWDYSNGTVADFFYHRLAPLLVSLGPRFPQLVSAHGGIYVWKDRETPETFSMTAEYEDFYVNISSSAASAGPERYHGPAIYGHEASIGFYKDYILVTPDRAFRKKFIEATGKPELRLEAISKDANEIRINHARNFFDCMRSRKQPVLHADFGYQVMTAIKLAADSYRQRRMFAFDARTEKIVSEAPPRPGYEGPGQNYEEPA